MNIYALLPDGKNLYIGHDDTGTLTASYNNTVTNNGSTRAYPTIKVKRGDDGTSARLELIKNETTGAVLYFDYSLLKNETLTINLTPGERSITSDYFGDVWRALLRGSDFSEFCLLPGSNNISVFVYAVGSPTMTCFAEWKKIHWGADMVAA